MKQTVDVDIQKGLSQALSRSSAQTRFQLIRPDAVEEARHSFLKNTAMHVPEEFRKFLHCILTFRSEAHQVVGETDARKGRTIFYRPQLLSAYQFDSSSGHRGQYLAIDDVDLDLDQLVLRTERCDDLEESDGSFLFSTVPLVVNPKAMPGAIADPPFLYLRRDRFLSLKNYIAAYLAKVIAEAKTADQDGVDHMRIRLGELRASIKRRVAQYEFKLFPPSFILNGQDMNQYYHLYSPRWKRDRIVEQIDESIKQIQSNLGLQDAITVVNLLGRQLIPTNKQKWLDFALANPCTFLRLNEID